MLQPETALHYAQKGYFRATEIVEPTALFSHYGAVRQVIELMRTQFAEPLSLADMADMACLSPFYFSRIFHRIVGSPPGEFLSALRLGAAKQLLLTTELSVTDVCFAVGYNAPGTFTTRFTQHVGIAPRHLRFLSKQSLDLKKTPFPSSLASVQQSINSQAYLSGHIFFPETFTGIIFLGVFPRPIPQGKPVRCMKLSAPGPFHLGPLPSGCWYVLAAAFPMSQDPSIYLLPEQVSLVGSVGPLYIQGNVIPAPIEVCLRPPCLTDPPIITALSPS